MHILALRTLKAFWEKHPQAERPLREWYALASKAHWLTPQDIKNELGGNVDFLADNRCVFDIGGNKYRLITYNAYTFGLIYVKFVGTHAEYDRIDAGTIDEH
ncbi:type II toxin-antitoxin system HigB family toxin [Devosia aquimaris]|uniref:type II toxin-antitoxin system HigB family toxin n=1 Tax=Devosia aquimaris TaxID=2866214 RepID=UPI001CD0E2D7|nr:type II toxin-antitoxin system HigB family toxin [Devosia sp. CJK-A8-3]